MLPHYHSHSGIDAALSLLMLPLTIHDDSSIINKTGKYNTPVNEIEYLDKWTEIWKNTAIIVLVNEQHRWDSAGRPFNDVSDSIDDHLTSFGHHRCSSELSWACDVCDQFF